MKHIYFLSLRQNRKWPRWDVASGFVVIAGTEREARKLAAPGAGDEGPAVWLDGRDTDCEQIGEARFGETEPGIVLRSFHAG